MQRREPISVRERWEMDVEIAKAKLAGGADKLISKLGPDGSEVEMKKHPVKLNSEDVETFFETVIATPEVATAISSAIHFFRENPDGEPDDSWGGTRLSFLHWWIIVRFDVNLVTLGRMSLSYTLATLRAFEEYFLTGSIEDAYVLLKQDAEKHGFSEAVAG